MPLRKMIFTSYWLIFGCVIQLYKTVAELPQLVIPPKTRQPQLRAYKPGDYIIGGIFPVHIDLYKDSTHCTRFHDTGLAWIESMIYATEKLSHSELLPDITLGYDIRDDCDELFRANEIALDFVSTPERSFLYTPTNVDRFTSSVNGTNKHENQVSNDPSERMTEQSVVAVIGPGSSDTAISTALIFSALRLPQISYAATSRILSDKIEYVSFFRTIPSDTYQVKAIVDIMVYFNWTYISLFGSDDNYGQLGMSSLEYEASKRNIDIALKKTFSYREIKDIVPHLIGYVKNNPIVSRSNVLVIFTQSHHAYALMKEFQKHNFICKTLFGTESWASSNWVLNLPPSIIKGSLGIKPFSRENDDFSRFFKTQTVHESSQRNPWFSEFVQLKGKTSGSHLKNYANHTLEELFGIDSRSLTLTAYVRDAVYVIAHALRKLLCTRDACVKKCISNEQLMHAVMETNFEGATGIVRFDKHGDAFGSYTILNVQENKNGKLRFRDVGRWNHSFLELKTEDIVWKGGKIVTSRCSDDCRPGHRKLLGSDNNCWACIRCEKGHFSNGTNMESCDSCVSVFGLGWNSNPEQTSCQLLPQIYLSWGESISTVLLAVSGFFCLLNLIALSMFVRFRNSYVIKGSNREVTFVLFGILFSCFLSPLIYIGYPNQIRCIIQPTYIALVLTSLILVILFKTYRILVIFELPPTTMVNIRADRKVRDRRHLLCLLTIELLGFSVMCTTTYVIQPQVTFHYSDGQHVYIDCGRNGEYLNCLALSIFGTLNIVSVYLAYRVRKLPENFNEAHQISSTVFILFLVWLVTLIAVLGPQAKLKTAYFCISVQVQALVVLLFMLLPKLKVVLCNPAKDTSEAIRMQTIAYVMKEQVKMRQDNNSTIATISNRNL